MIKELEVFKEIGFFVCKYRRFCKSVSSKRIIPVEWDTERLNESFNPLILDEMLKDEKHITDLIKLNPNIDLYVGEEYIMNLLEKYEKN